MPQPVISVENLSKSYQLGTISTGTLFRDVERWWAKKRGKPDPFLKIGDVDHGNRLGETVWALKDINFSVDQGDTLGIIGLNGAGKSTLLKILSRVTAPTSGTVKIKGRIASLLEVGTGFHAELTGRENIYLNGAINGMSRAEVKCKLDEIVDFSGVEKYIDTPVKRYSSGMYVRLAFSVAAHLDPEILIVDEVLSVGDATFQQKAIGKMGRVSKEGRTVLFVSHNLSAVNLLCQNGLLIEKGKILSHGDIDTIIEKYLEITNNNTSDSKPSQNCLDLPRRYEEHGKLIRIQSCEFHNSRDELINTICVGEDFCIQFDVRGFNNLENIYAMIQIFTPRQESLCTSYMEETGLILNIRRDEIKKVSAHFKGMRLRGGKYSIDIYLSQGDRGIDVLYEILTFEVKAKPVTVQIHGPLNPLMEWKVT